MALSRCWRVVVCLFFLFGSSLVLTVRLHASDVESATTAKPIEVSVPANKIEPQIVRISYLEGDVRIARGTKAATWEAAVSGLPLEAGYTLATGVGRAEIEFEDASTVYLGENSVLAFNDLLAADAVPITVISLLTGTVTLNIHPVAGEFFLVATPANRVLIKPPGVYERVTSYLDAMAVTSFILSVNTPSMAGSAIEYQAKGKTTFYHADAPPTAAADPGTSEDFTEWDHWVADRVAAREEAISMVMRESGLTTPIAGLADLYGNGTFFSCPPYGTCWEPADPPANGASMRGASVDTLRLTPASMSASLAVYRFRQASVQLAAFGSPSVSGEDTPGASPHSLRSQDSAPITRMMTFRAIRRVHIERSTETTVLTIGPCAMPEAGFIGRTTMSGLLEITNIIIARSTG